MYTYGKRTIVKNYHYKIRIAKGLKKYQITNTLHLQMEDL